MTLLKFSALSAPVFAVLFVGQAGLAQMAPNAMALPQVLTKSATETPLLVVEDRGDDDHRGWSLFGDDDEDDEDDDDDGASYGAPNQACRQQGEGSAQSAQTCPAPSANSAPPPQNKLFQNGSAPQVKSN